MGHYKRQHWVPQSYLRRFSADGDHVCMFDRPTGRTALPHVRDVAQDRYFYDGFLRDADGATPPDVPDGVVEQALGVFEGLLATATEVAERVAAGGGAGPEERVTMAACVALQLVRTPAFRRRLADGVTGAIEAEANAFLAERMPEFAADYRAVPTFPHEWAGALHFKYGLAGDLVEELTADLYHYIWQVGVNQCGVPLCTSDTPVVVFVHDADGQRPAGASAERKRDVVRQLLVGDRPVGGIEVIFPVTPRVLLCMYHPTYFAHLRPKQGKAFGLGIEEVLHYNALQFLNAERQAYAPEDVFGLVRKHAATYTQLEL